MPVILITKNLKISIYPKDHDPPHIHVQGPDCQAKFYLNTIKCYQSYGFSRKDLVRIAEFLESNIELLNQAWEEYHED